MRLNHVVQTKALFLFYYISFALKKQTKKKHFRHANTTNKNVTNIRAGAPQQLKPITADPKLL